MTRGYQTTLFVCLDAHYCDRVRSLTWARGTVLRYQTRRGCFSGTPVSSCMKTTVCVNKRSLMRYHSLYFKQ